MTILNATEARSKLYSLIDGAAASRQLIVIAGKDQDLSRFSKRCKKLANF